MIFANRLKWDRAENATVLSKGKTYIDFTSGIFTANIGHNNQSVSDALVKASCRVPSSYTYRTSIKERYVDALCEFTGYESVALFSSGTEATEAAWRMATEFTGTSGIVAPYDGFHGKTHGAKGFIRGDFDSGVTVIAEPYSPLDVSFRDDVELGLDDIDNPQFLIMDEIQAGFGRTGRMFGYEHIGVKPNLVCIGKAMGNGVVPISGVLGPAAIVDNPAAEPSSTMGGCDLACHVGLAVIEYFKEHNIIEQAAEMGAELQRLLRDVQCESNGQGMVAALLFPTKLIADCVVKLAEDRGLILVHTGHNTVKIGPPLTIDYYYLKKGVEILKGVVDECNVASRRN